MVLLISCTQLPAVGRLPEVRVTGTRGCRREPVTPVVAVLDTFG